MMRMGLKPTLNWNLCLEPDDWHWADSFSRDLGITHSAFGREIFKEARKQGIKLGFKDMPIKLMIHFDINELIKE